MRRVLENTFVPLPKASDERSIIIKTAARIIATLTPFVLKIFHKHMRPFLGDKQIINITRSAMSFLAGKMT